MATSTSPETIVKYPQLKPHHDNSIAIMVIDYLYDNIQQDINGRLRRITKEWSSQLLQHIHDRLGDPEFCIDVALMFSSYSGQRHFKAGESNLFDNMKNRRKYSEC